MAKAKTSIEICRTDTDQLAFVLTTKDGKVLLSRNELADLALQATSSLRYNSLDEVFAAIA